MRHSDDKRYRIQSSDRRPAHRAPRDRSTDLPTPALAAASPRGKRVSRTRWRRAVRRVRELSSRVHDLKADNDELRRLAYRDPLTGLLNRRGFEEQLQRWVSAASERRTELAVLLLDVDELKRINDTHGHATGDLALRSVAEALRRSVRGGDHVARLAGDEFAVLLPRTGRDMARQIAERVRRALHRASAAAGVPVTLSAGVSVLERGTGIGASADRLLRRADEALYAAKRAGRDRVDVASSRAGGEQALTC